MNFEEWKEEQIKLGNLRLVQKTNKVSNKGDLTGKWRDKFFTKKTNCRDQIKFDLTFEEYLYKAYEAGITCPKQVSRKGNQEDIYHLARVGDQGDYTVSNCRFITAKENYKERDEHTDNSVIMSNHNRERVKNGTHNLLGYKKRAWESNNSNETSIKVWGLADQAYIIWKEDNVAGVMISRKLGINVCQSIHVIVKKFKEGWIPMEDKEWLEFYNKKESRSSLD